MVCDHSTMELVVTEVRALMLDSSAQLTRPFPLRNLVAQAGRIAPTEHEAYFREQLGDIDEPTAPFGILDVQVKTTDLRNSGVRLDQALADRIRDCAGQLGVPPSVLFHVAWAQVLARCTGREDVVFGTVLSGRLQGAAGADRALGMFINTLPLRLSLGGDARQVIQQSYERMVSLLAHEQAPLVLAQRCSAVPMPAPLFTTLLNYRHSVDATIPVAAQEMEGLRRLSVHEAANYPLSASVDDYGTTFAISAECSRSIDPKRIVNYVLTAVTGIVDALTNEQSLATVDILPAAERTKLLVDFNATGTADPSDKLIHQLFEESAAAQPDAPAVIFEDESLTYAELNARANQLAHELIARGVQPDDRVAIYAERSIATMVGLLGILKSGGAYVALDASYPAERIQHMLTDAAPKVVLTDVLFPSHPTHNPEPATTPRNLAYVIYTSGSTGMPKGVMVEHRGVVNMLTAQAAMCELTPRDRVLQFASLAFDSSVAEIFPAWSAGAAVVLRPADGGLADFASFLDRHAITVADIPTALWRQSSQALNATCESLRLVIVSGEAMESRDVEQWFSHPGSERIALLNNYGPTEATVNATAHPVVPAPVIPIGRPIANTRIYILDRRGEPVPAGVDGEIFIGGVGVARGYLNRLELTAERFVRNPFDEGVMYKTGDLGRWLADGTIEFRGRNDFQVKIRGFRIELGEIEAKLAELPGVREAVVIAREDTPGDKRLVAYFSRSAAAELPLSDDPERRLAPPHSYTDLRAALAAQLPEPMIPSAFVQLETLPLTTNGKLDRKALPAPDAMSFAAREYEAPEGEIETTLAAIWQDLLGIPQVGRNDHFFELGGHSLRAITLTVRVQEQLHVELPLKTIFTTPRMADLAQFIAQTQQSLISEEQVVAMQSELDSLSDEELLAFLGGNGLG
jgi:amino acid adenylation domain-containing protein